MQNLVQKVVWITKKAQILCEVLWHVYNAFKKTDVFINQRLMGIFNREEVPVDQVFSICFSL